jgi:hypothetical protein
MGVPFQLRNGAPNALKDSWCGLHHLLPDVQSSGFGELINPRGRLARRIHHHQDDADPTVS